MSAARRLTASVLALAAVLAAAGCSGSAAPRRTVTKYVDPSPVAPSSSVSTATGSSAAPSTAAPSPPADLRKLPGTCDDLLPQSDVETALHATLSGDTAFVVGQPDASIHRVGYINCRYGVGSPTAVPGVEIQVSLYGTPAQAASRIAPTVSDYRGHGAGVQDATAGGIPAKLLTGGSGDDAAPTIVLAFGQRTVAVSLGDAVAADRRQADLETLATLAVRRTQ
jgi:hypothetical protein